MARQRRDDGIRQRATVNREGHRARYVSMMRENRGVPDEKLHTWIKAEETYARSAAASWIGHPHVCPVLDEARPAAVAACPGTAAARSAARRRRTTVGPVPVPPTPPTTTVSAWVPYVLTGTDVSSTEAPSPPASSTFRQSQLAPPAAPTAVTSSEVTPAGTENE
jgi:hypothetical protein